MLYLCIIIILVSYIPQTVYALYLAIMMFHVIRPLNTAGIQNQMFMYSMQSSFQSVVDVPVIHCGLVISKQKVSYHMISLNSYAFLNIKRCVT